MTQTTANQPPAESTATGAAATAEGAAAQLATQIQQWQAQIVTVAPEARAQIVAAAKESLGAAYWAAEQRGDQDTMAITASAYQHIETLSLHADTAHAVASGATAAAAKIASDHAALSKEHEGLIDAIENVDMTNQRVQQLASEIEDAVHENMDGFYTECFGCDMCNRGVEVDHDLVNDFAYAAFVAVEDLPAPLVAELVKFIHTWTPKANAAVNGEEYDDTEDAVMVEGFDDDADE